MLTSSLPDNEIDRRFWHGTERCWPRACRQRRSRHESIKRQSQASGRCRGMPSVCRADGRQLETRSSDGCSDRNDEMTREPLPRHRRCRRRRLGPAGLVEGRGRLPAARRHHGSALGTPEALPIRRHVHDKQGSVYAFDPSSTRGSELARGGLRRARRFPRLPLNNSPGPRERQCVAASVGSTTSGHAAPGARSVLSRRRFDRARRRGHCVRCRTGPGGVVRAAGHHVPCRAPAREPLRQSSPGLLGGGVDR